MPNTLAHIGVNGLLSRSLIKKSNLFWIYFGTLIPDIPWILQRVAGTIFPTVNGFDLRLYVIVQATLFLSLILSLALSFTTETPKKTFIILALGSLFHLLLDSLQIKWGNGVHLFAPFNWKLLNFGFFWPESLPTYILTFGGFLFFVFSWKTLTSQKLNLSFKFPKVLITFIFLLIYYLLPFYFMPQVENANNHFVKTLRDVQHRAGKYVEFDRKKIRFNKVKNQYEIQTFDRSYIPLVGIKNTDAYKISIKGIFIDNNTIKVTDFHKNIVWFRDGATYVGIVLIIISGFVLFRKENLTNKT